MQDQSLRRAKILGLGFYVPEKVVTNKDLEKMVDTTDEWIQTRTGIKERRVVGENEATSDLATAAAREAIKDAGINAEEIDLIIVSTISADMYFPSTACLVQANLGIHCPAFDLSAACSGYPYGLAMATNLIQSGAYKNILVIGAEAISKFIDWTDRSTCILFGDGAGATVVGVSDDESGVLSLFLGADGSKGDLLRIPAGGSRIPSTEETVRAKLHTLEMSGAEIFKLATKHMAEAATACLEEAGLTSDDIALFIPHQANLRIINALAKKMKISTDRIYINLQKYGNMSAASTIVALVEAAKEGRIKKGDNVLLVAFGAGLTWASCIIRW
jgi:3-oxoacyl-[acyl-carrier-protein] synthase-3